VVRCVWLRTERCWAEDPVARPSFDEVVEVLEAVVDSQSEALVRPSPSARAAPLLRPSSHARVARRSAQLTAGGV
jgi:hypothetical protein